MTGTNGNAPILDLDDLLEDTAPTWKFGGEVHSYVRWSALGLLERKRIDNRHKRVLAIEAIEEPSEAEAAEYELGVREMLKMITVGIADDEVDAMEPEQRSEVVTNFLAYRLWRMSDLSEKRQAAARKWAETLMPDPPTSETSSPDSKSDSPRRTRKAG